MPVWRNVPSFVLLTKNMVRMGIFNKKEKKLRKELAKRQAAFCYDVVKELQELHDELKAAYGEVEIMEEFAAFRDSAAERMGSEDIARLDAFLARFKSIDKMARNAIRDVRDVLRNQKKRLRESVRDE